MAIVFPSNVQQLEKVISILKQDCTTSETGLGPGVPIHYESNDTVMGDFASKPSWLSTSALILFFVIFNISSSILPPKPRCLNLPAQFKVEAQRHHSSLFHGISQKIISTTILVPQGRCRIFDAIGIFEESPCCSSSMAAKTSRCSMKCGRNVVAEVIWPIEIPRKSENQVSRIGFWPLRVCQ